MQFVYQCISHDEDPLDGEIANKSVFTLGDYFMSGSLGAATKAAALL